MKISDYLKKRLNREGLEARPGRANIMEIIEQAVNNNAKLNVKQREIAVDLICHAQLRANEETAPSLNVISVGLQIATFINSCR